MKRWVDMISGSTGYGARNFIILKFKSLSPLTIFKVSTSFFIQKQRMINDYRLSVEHWKILFHSACILEKSFFHDQKSRVLKIYLLRHFLRYVFTIYIHLNTAHFSRDRRTKIFKFVFEFCYRTPPVKCGSLKYHSYK